MHESIKKSASISSIFFLILVLLYDLEFYSILGISLFFFFLIKFFIDIGKTVEIRDLIIIIALLQWIIGPILKYHISTNDIFYYMAVPEDKYIKFVFPASLLFIIGLYFPFVYVRINSENQIQNIYTLLKKYRNIDYVLIGLGVIFYLLLKVAPSNIKFFVYLLSLTRYVGLFFLLLNDRKYKWHIFSITIFALFLESIRNVLFHEMLLWIVFLFIFIAFLYKFKIKQKLLILIPIVIFAVLLQSIKFYFRVEANQYSNTFDRAGLFTNMFVSELQTGDKTLSIINLDAAINRINQGWIVARIMRYTPYLEPFANGETILTGIEASLVPRILKPDKAKAGGRDNFERFTGKRISKNTSMGLSPLGEAYANFGINGGIFFMFLLGLFYNLYMSILVKLTNKFPSLILWLPLLFLQVVKAETDFVVVLNHLVKATIVVFIIIFSIRKIALIKL